MNWNRCSSLLHLSVPLGTDNCSSEAPMLTRVWQKIEYRIDVCRATSGAHIEHV
jgi:hypothetical protein